MSVYFDPISTVYVTNLLLLAGFVLNLWFQMRHHRAVPFYLPWLLFWCSILIQTALEYTHVSLVHNRWIQMADSAFALIGPMFLLVSSEFVTCNTVPDMIQVRRSVAWLKWVIPMLAILVALPAIPGPTLIFIIYLSLYLSIAVYAGRYGQASNKEHQWATLLLYFYAATYIFFKFTHGNREYFPFLALMALSVPLKIVLYYTGYANLARFHRCVFTHSKIQDHDTQDLTATSSHASSTIVPTISVEFKGFWGFIYVLLTQKPSGWLVVLFMLAALIAALSFLGMRFPELVILIEELIRK